MVNGRISYVNWLLNSSSTEEVKNSASDFYDLTGRITFRPNLNHLFSLSGFTSDDDFVFNKEFGFQYSSKNIEFLYRGFYGDKLTSRFSATVRQTVAYPIGTGPMGPEANPALHIRKREASPSSSLEKAISVTAILRISTDSRPFTLAIPKAREGMTPGQADVCPNR